MVGERILGRFRIEDRIGSGGFGTVYRAWDERLQRPVAVKVIDREHGALRVTREAQAVARLSHRNIATLYELASDGDRAFLVSELIEGETLR
ncbi:MAG: eukaryotic-like serine/threonine-protein kinase, partial [Solirubrobacterales bacterium]|nr:eukaryotic-like serine/threonine-protein kinase [Solirubrobacterales bacterium]